MFTRKDVKEIISEANAKQDNRRDKNLTIKLGVLMEKMSNQDKATAVIIENLEHIKDTVSIISEGVKHTNGCLADVKEDLIIETTRNKTREEETDKNFKNLKWVFGAIITIGLTMVGILSTEFILGIKQNSQQEVLNEQYREGIERNYKMITEIKYKKVNNLEIINED